MIRRCENHFNIDNIPSSVSLFSPSLVSPEATLVFVTLIGWFSPRQLSLVGLEAPSGPELSLALDDCLIFQEIIISMDHHNVPIIYFDIISYYAEISHKIIQQSPSLEDEIFQSREDLVSWFWMYLLRKPLTGERRRTVCWLCSGGRRGRGREYSPRVSPSLPQLSPCSTRWSQYFLLHLDISV